MSKKKKSPGKSGGDVLGIVEQSAREMLKMPCKSVIFRYANDYGFKEFDAKFVLDVVQAARIRLALHGAGLDELNALERLGLMVLKEASEKLGYTGRIDNG